jgi:F0F1-type ATP synthase assembly protein I
MPSSENPDPRQLGRYYAIAQVGLEMVVPIAVAWWLDQQLDTAPWLLVLGVIGGLVLGIGHLIVLTRDDDAQAPKDPKP